VQALDRTSASTDIGRPQAATNAGRPPRGYNTRVTAAKLKRERTVSSRTEIVQQLFDAFNTRDPNTALSLLHPEIVFEPVSGAVLNGGEPYVGKDGMRQYFADVQEHWQELVVKPVHMRAAGDAVVALGHASGRGPAGSLDDVPATWVFKFDGDLVAHIRIFSDEQLAREALAGPS
jgi:ketosteroid isomerase-like protein